MEIRDKRNQGIQKFYDELDKNCFFVKNDNLYLYLEEYCESYNFNDMKIEDFYSDDLVQLVDIDIEILENIG